MTDFSRIKLHIEVEWESYERVNSDLCFICLEIYLGNNPISEQLNRKTESQNEIE